MERLDITQLTNDERVIKAHNILLDCGWELDDRSTLFCLGSIVYKNKSDRLYIFSTSERLLFQVNGDGAKELAGYNLIRAILFLGDRYE